MAKLAGLLLFVGALAAAVALVPVGGRTVLDRYQASRGPADFASRTWHEVARATGLSPHRTQKPAAGGQRHPARKAEPAERHTDADRAEIDRIVEEHARR